MSRKVYCRLRLKGTLVADSPLHVGGHGEDVESDLPLARDGARRFYLPGTSLAGSLREHCVKLFGNSFVTDIWGFQEDDAGHASWVVIENAVIENSERVLAEIRDGVGIDRQWGAAAEHIKYDRAILPRGTRAKFELAVECGSQERRQSALAMATALMESLQTGRIRLGAAKTRGLGRVRLEDAQLTQQRFSSRDGILALLRGEDQSKVPDDECRTAPESFSDRRTKLPRLSVRIEWRPVGPVMVKDGMDGIAVDMLPLASGVGDKLALVLPGSSVKGAFRSHAERIVRTVKGISSPPWLTEKDPKRKFLTALELPLIDELFGRRGRDMPADSTTSPSPGLGALSASDCYSTATFTRPQWRAIQSAGDDRSLRSALHAADLPSWAEAYHCAVDRWTGGAADTMLYSVLEPHRVEWEPLHLDVDLLRLAAEDRLAAVVLLLLVLRDAAQQRIPLGFGGHRGMGAIEIQSIHFAVDQVDSPLDALHNVSMRPWDKNELPQQLATELNEHWKAWIARSYQEATS